MSVLLGAEDARKGTAQVLLLTHHCIAVFLRDFECSDYGWSFLAIGEEI